MDERKYIKIGSKNFIIGSLHFLVQFLAIVYLAPEPTWKALPNGMSFSVLVMIILGSISFAIGSVTIFISLIFFRYRARHSRESAYAHALATAKWGLSSLGIILLIYIVLILTSVLSIRL